MHACMDPRPERGCWLTPRRFGMSLGSDQNASTTCRTTDYSLSMPTDPKGVDNVDAAMNLLYQLVVKATFPEKEVANERTVVLAELKTTRNVHQRLYERMHKMLHNDCLIGSRLPGGKEAMVAKFTREDLLRFYKLYDPNRMTLFCVGNVEPGRAIDQLDKFFSLVKNRVARPLRDLSKRTFRMPKTKDPPFEVALHELLDNFQLKVYCHSALLTVPK